MTQERSTGHSAAVLIAVLVAVAQLAPPVARAQEPVKTFDQLNTLLKVGDTIRVTDARGREHQGKVKAVCKRH